MTATPTERDLEILAHVVRHGLTTRGFLQQVFFPAATTSAVAKVVQRLVKNQWLREYCLGTGFSYLVLGRQASSFLAGDCPLSRRFTEQNFPLAYGFLAFCLTHQLRRLTSQEFMAQYPDLCRPGMATGRYFIDTRQQPYRLGTILLDRGNPPKNILRKLERTARQRYTHPTFTHLIQNGLFTITILTAWPLKQEYLQVAVRQAFRSLIAVDVVTVPELQAFYRRV